MSDDTIQSDAIPVIPAAPEVPETATVEELRSILGSFTKVIAAVPEAIKALDRRTGLLRRLFWVIVSVLVVDILATGYIAYSVKVQRDTAARLDVSVHQQCKLYALLIPTYHGGAAPQRLASPLGPQGYDAAYIGIQQSADALACGIKHSVPGT